MDLLSVAGLVLAAVAILAGATLKGAGIQVLLSTAAFFIVVVGTIAAICVQTPLAAMKRALSVLPWIVKPPHFDDNALINMLVDWSGTARRQGLLGLEEMLQDPTLDDFLRRGLQLLVDGSEPQALREVLEVELTNREQADTRAARVFEGMGVYSPTLGIIGAVLGLMAVMQNLADPTKLGHGIAAAFVATVYGIGLANLVFLPIANKLKSIVQRQAQVREMIIEGLASITQGENPRNIELKLQGYLH
ncbi:MAG TPA: flagellar motor protein [Steroidobacteraceae bacterium]|nr:flagellar motor protein [Steroidobacteraceae bacterium]